MSQFPLLNNTYNRNKIETITQYLEHTSPKPYEEIVNGFTHNGQRYPLTQKMGDHIYDNILMKLSTEEQKKIVIKQSSLRGIKRVEKQVEQVQKNHKEILEQLYPEILKGLRLTVDLDNKNKESYFNEFFYLLPQEEKELTKALEEIALIIKENLCHTLLETVWSTFEEKTPMFQITFTDLSINIGASIIIWFFDKSSVKLKYEIGDSFSKIKMTPIEQAKIFSSENSLKEFYTKQAIGETLYKKHISNKLRKWYENAHFIHAFETTPLPLDEFISYANYKGITKLDDQQLLKLKKSLPISLGAFFVEKILLNSNILEESKEARANVLTLTQKYIGDIMISHAYYKPLLAPGTTGILQTNVEDSKLKQFAFDLHTRTNSNYVHKFKHDKSEELKEVLKPNIEFCINSPFWKSYITYLQEIYEIPFIVVLTDPDSQEADDVCNYILVEYELQIKEALKEINDISFSKNLLKFMQNLTLEDAFDVKFFKSLNSAYKKAKKLFQTAYKEAAEVDEAPKQTLSALLFTKNNENLDSLKAKVNKAKFKLDIFSKIASKKYFLTHFLADVDLYNYFDHFFIQREISGVGRNQTIPVYLSLQTNKTSRPMICSRTSEKGLNKYTFDKFKEKIAKILPHIAEEINQLTYKSYMEKTLKTQDEYLLSFFKDTTKEELSKLDSSSLKNSIKFLIRENKFKKIETSFIGLSMLHYKQYTKEYCNIEPFVNLDSTASGTQHVATIFCDKTAATHSCLLGTKKIDLNKECLGQFDTLITKDLSRLSQRYLDTLNSSREDLQTDLPLDVLHKLICKKLNIMYIKSNFNDIFDFFIKIFNLYKNNDFKDISDIPEISAVDEEQYSSLLDKRFAEIKQRFYPENKKLTDYLLITILDINLTLIFKKLPWLNKIMTEREVIKTVLMAKCYGMTARGGIYTINDAIIDLAYTAGFYDINLRYLKVFSTMLSGFFSKYFRKNNLDYMIKVKKLGRFVKYLKKPLILSHEYLTWEYAPKKIETFTLALRSCLKDEFKVLLNETDEKENDPLIPVDKKLYTKYSRRFIKIAYSIDTLDKRKMRNAVLAFIVHTVEAYLLMYWLMICLKIKVELSAVFNISFNYTPNYDCFGVNFSNAGLLDFTLKHAYRNNYKQPFYTYIQKMFEGKENQRKWFEARAEIRGLVNNPYTKNYWDGIITNPFYVKP